MVNRSATATFEGLWPIQPTDQYVQRLDSSVMVLQPRRKRGEVGGAKDYPILSKIDFFLNFLANFDSVVRLWMSLNWIFLN